jgi:RES domain-containing protein
MATGDRDLTARMKRCRTWAGEWHGTIYRSTTPAYAASKDMLSGEGSRRHGGRWNAPGTFPAVYGSLDPETAMAEALAHFRYYGIPLAAAMPRIFVAIDVALSTVLDVQDRRVLQTLGVTRARIVHSNWRALGTEGERPVTQVIGEAACAAGLEAILVPSSARNGGGNLVSFPGNLGAAARLAVRRPES